MSDKYDLAVRSTDEIGSAGASYAGHKVLLVDANGVPVQDTVTNFVTKSGSVAASLSAAGLPDPAVASTYLKRNSGNTAYEAKTADEVATDVGLPTVTASTYLKANAGGTAYEAKTAANVLSDIMGGTTANSTDIVLGKRMTNPSQPMFYAIQATQQANVTGDNTAATFIADSQLNDVGDCYNPSTGVFTAPVSGLYALSFCVGLMGITSSHTGASIQMITSNRIHVVAGCNPYACQYNSGGDVFLDINGSVITYMDAGDTAFVRVYVGGGTKVVGLSAGSSNFFFSGYLVA